MEDPPRTYLQLKDEREKYSWIDRIPRHPWTTELQELSFSFWSNTQFSGETIIWTPEAIGIYRRTQEIWELLETCIHQYVEYNYKA
jgi:hypothetical protein